MDRTLYRAGQFARKAAVSIRTLRYYDQEGLLAPSGYTESGYRLYTDEDLVNLQQILALKFLGFSLEEIKALLRGHPRHLHDVLAQQKAMMQAKRTQLNQIIAAIERTEALLQTDACDWEALINVIQVIQMDQNRDWVHKYLTPEQIEQMRKLSEQSYSEEAKQRLAERAAAMGGWTEADQERASAAWTSLGADAAQLAAAGADPASAEAQALAARYDELIAGFTGRDPAIQTGLQQWWQNHDALPAQQQMPQWAPPEAQAFLQRAAAIYRQKQ